MPRTKTRYATGSGPVTVERSHLLDRMAPPLIQKQRQLPHGCIGQTEVKANVAPRESAPSCGQLEAWPLE